MLARLSSSLADDPAIVCLLYCSDCTLNMLLESSSPAGPPQPRPFGLGGFVLLVTDDTDGAFEGGVDGE